MTGAISLNEIDMLSFCFALFLSGFPPHLLMCLLYINNTLIATMRMMFMPTHYISINTIKTFFCVVAPRSPMCSAGMPSIPMYVVSVPYVSKCYAAASLPSWTVRKNKLDKTSWIICHGCFHSSAIS